MKKDTIIAISSPPGEGAISIVRISGPDALPLGAALFSRPLPPSHTVLMGKILDKEGLPLDQVLLLVLRSPKSYTGEDTVEIFCHGGALLTRKILERGIEVGARLANPGEFSYRAYLNGKIDLVQAEAVQMAIHAKNEQALSFAEKHLLGELSQKIRSFQDTLLQALASLEAAMDFPEEDIEALQYAHIEALLSPLLFSMQKLQQTFHHGKLVELGFTLCLLGAPNVGKSSLMNAFLREERAIVTPIAGTTRDTLQETVRIGSLHCHLLDTAGIRDTTEIVEQEGIRRSFLAMEKADCILLLLDATRPLLPKERELLSLVPPHKTFLVWNKVDEALPQESLPLECLSHRSPYLLSAKTKEGMDLLEKGIENYFYTTPPPSQEEVVLTKERHFAALSQALHSVEATLTGLHGKTPLECLALELKSALTSLSQILGIDVTEEVLTTIFQKFCLGK